MIPAGVELNKTISWRDLGEPAARRMGRRLLRFLWRMSLGGERVAVNGVLRKRWYVRKHKIWEYARGLAYSEPQPEQAILDFGGGATLPVFFLASRGARVRCLDIDEELALYTNSLARERGWTLEASATDILERRFPEGWGPFDRIFSFCVIEHLPKSRQPEAVALLAAKLKPGGRCVLTFDFGNDAPEGGAIREVAEVEELIAASGLKLLGGGAFRDTGERFVLNRRHKDKRFTFGSVFLERPGEEPGEH